MAPKDTAEIRYYFDWAATAPPDGAAAVSVPFGNPSSLHAEGRAARQALEDARARCAAVLGLPRDTLYFTSGGTESNCIALHSTLVRRGGGRIIASAAEHASIRENIAVLERLGRPCGTIPVDSVGRVSPAGLAATLEKYGDVRFAAIMAVNNETGSISDLSAIRDTIRKRSGPPVHLHCDLVQAAGKIPLDITGWDIDSASVSAHKIGGPRGIGLLYLRKPLEALCVGGGQEGRIRSGTENVAGALALAACLENHAAPGQALAAQNAATVRMNRLLDGLAALPRCRLIPLERKAGGDNFSPWILQAAFADIPGEVMTRALDDMGFAVSTGSACSSSSQDRPALAAMGITEQMRLEGIRISQGWTTTAADIDCLLKAITEVLRFL